MDDSPIIAKQRIADRWFCRHSQKNKAVNLVAVITLLVLTPFLFACTQAEKTKLEQSQAKQSKCLLVEEENAGPLGTVPVKAEKVVSGLEVPWALAFLPSGDLLVTERPGRLRLVSAGKLISSPVVQIPVIDSGEEGMLGLALHPDFSQNSLRYY